MDDLPTTDIAWRKSRFCNNGGCVEIAITEYGVLIRDSKEAGQIVEVSRQDWTTFLAGVRSGDFDLS